MELFEIWKALSILFTGGFGMLGLLTEFKHPRSKRISKWGYVSLAGILFSTVGGVWAQLAEIASDQKAAAEANKRILAIVSATSSTLTNTREVIDTTNQATGDIRRLLSPLGSSRVMLSWEVPCKDNKSYRPVCNALAQHKFGGAPFTLATPLPWPKQPHGTILTVSFKPNTGGPTFLLTGNSDAANPGGPRFRMNGDADNLHIQFDELFFFDPPAGGVLKGLFDLVEGEGSTVILEAPYTDFTLVGVRWTGQGNDILVSESVRPTALAAGDARRAFLFKLKPLLMP